MSNDGKADLHLTIVVEGESFDSGDELNGLVRIISCQSWCNKVELELWRIDVFFNKDVSYELRN